MIKISAPSNHEQITVNADPYAPPSVPTDNPAAAPKNQTRKTLFIWLALIVMFVTIYQCLRPEGGSHTARPAPQATEDPGFWGAMLSSWLPPLLFLLVVVWIFRQLRASKGYNKEYNAATLAIADGDLERALQGFRTLAEKNKRKQFATNANVNVAWMLQRLGRFDEEREVLLQIERSPGLLYASEQRMYAAIYLARHFALRGDVEHAQKWLADAQRRRERNADLGLFVIATLRVTEAMVLARKGDESAALALLGKDWPRIELGFTANLMKHVLVLRAYLLARTGGVRGDGVASQWLAKARPMRLDEIAHLWKEWPQLQAWAETQHITSVGGGEAPAATA